MVTKNNSVVPIYKSHAEPEAAVKELQQSGFDIASAGAAPVTSAKFINKERAKTRN
jgi:hypothetical protein